MPLPIISADQRLAEHRGIKGCIFGKSGIGKTSLLKTLDPATTLFFDLEAGDLAIGDWPVTSIRPQTWEECRDFALFIGGANPTHRPEQFYSPTRFKEVCEKFGNPDSLDGYETIFIDSITVAGRLCFQWCKGQPEAKTASGKPDNRSAYGLHGQEMIAWLTHLQHTRHKNIWFVGILDEKMDDFNRRYYQPQIEGSKTGLELPGIVDQVITMAELKGWEKDKDGKDIEVPYRAFVCHTLNPDNYPAKDRSGKLDCIEQPHLGNLMKKINSFKH
ncbi:hypothetical protein Cva_00667 [Caedimonas varicaedens]|uniref:AAA domain-containing protein n=1 Tax=Caedimonas varicaedens TaxID=1629334 RepID=A0A0K8MDU8_9PROT|nr:hypothetical protein Cva_00667 [Caedimonas varicaedens]